MNRLSTIIKVGFVFITILTTVSLSQIPIQEHSSNQLKQSKTPNIVFILCDDLGWKDLGTYGSTFYESPNIDKLASQGMKFMDAYASSTVCSPSRSSIMTGDYPVNTGITDWIVGMQNTQGPRPEQKLVPPQFSFNLPTGEETIAQNLKKQGYDTFFAGKWHLGIESSSWPKAKGFDENFGGWAAGNPRYAGMGGYFSPYHNPKLKDGPKGEFLTDRLTTETINFIKRKAKQGKPFFADLSFYAVHEPIEAKQKYIDKFKQKAHQQGLDTLRQFIQDTTDNHPGWMPNWKERMVQSNPVYAGLIYSVDENVGRVMNALKELGIEDNTIVVFTSDNGGLSTGGGSPTTNYPLRYGKGWAYEGGIRIPLIIKWPGVAQPGSVSHFPVVNTDIYPTFSQIASSSDKAEQEKDGVSLVPLLKGEKKIDQSTIYWHYPHYHGAGATPVSSIRQGDWKLLQFYNDNHIELYNLRTDIEERRDLKDTYPDIAAKLLQKLNQWRSSENAKVPTINPHYNPYYQEIMRQNKETYREYIKHYQSLFGKEVYDPELFQSIMEKWHEKYGLR